MEGEVCKIVTSSYFLSAKDYHENVITRVVFSGINYDEWVRKAPEEGSENEDDWRTVNAMVTLWIFNTIEPRLRSSITHREIAKDLWDIIKARFIAKSEVRVKQLKEELMKYKQRDMSLETYYGKLQVIWEDLSNYEYKPVFICRKCKWMHIRTDVVYDRDRVKESRREAMGFTVNTRRTQLRGDSRNNNRGSLCTHCNKSGHDAGTCYQLHGYHEWWLENYGKGRRNTPFQQPYKNKASYGRGASVNAVSHTTQPVEANAINGLSKEQWEKLVRMLGEKPEETRLNVPPCLVGLPNGKLVMADQEGSIALTENMALHGVLYVKELKCNLISVSQLIDELNYYDDVLFYDDDDRVSETEECAIELMEEHGTEIGVAESFTEAKEESIVHDNHAEVREESSVEATKTHEEEVVNICQA
ncbi:unnamed protein product [Brassica oleracea]